MNKRLLLLILFVGAGLLLFVNSAFYSTNSEGDKYNVSIILPLSGEFGALGESIINGLELSISDYNLSDYYNINYNDNQYRLEEDVKIASKNIFVDKTDIIFIPFLPDAKVVLPLTEKEKIPTILFWDSGGYLNYYNYGVSIGYNVEDNAYKLANFASKRNMKTCSIIGHQDEWSKVMGESFKEKFEELGGKISNEEYVSLDNKDFKTEVAKILNSDCIFFPMIPSNIISFIKEIRVQDYNGLLLSGDGLLPEIISALGDYANGIIFTTMSIDDSISNKPLDSISTFGYRIGLILDVCKTSKTKELFLSCTKDLNTDVFNTDHFGVSHKVENLYLIETNNLKLIE